jgi:signal transduction histidine kinase
MPPPGLDPLPPAGPREGFGRLRLRGWFLLGGAAFGAVFVVAVLVTLITLAQTHRARINVIDVVDPATLHTLELSTALTAQDSAVRAYGLTGDARYRQAFERAAAAEKDAFDRISGLLPDMPERSLVAADLTALRRATEDWHHDYADLALREVAQNGTKAYTEALIDTGAHDFMSVQDALGAQQNRLIRLSRSGRDELDAGWNTFYWVLGGLALVLIATAVVFAFIVRHAVLRPVSRLAGQVREVAQGDFERRLHVDRPAELAELSDHVDAMRARIVAEWRTMADGRRRLSDQAAELSRSNAELEQFAYVASHDLQEPLRKIASFTQILEQRYGEQLDERAKQYIGFAVDGAKRMQRLINDLLDFSRVGRVGGERARVDCAEALATALVNLSAQIEDVEADVAAHDMPVVVGNRLLLTQLFQNIVGNALKFRSEEPPRIRIAARRDGAMWEFSCADNGIGIASKHADRIFLIFQRLHPRDVYPGTGIGLALCKKIVEYHGGEIWVDPKSGPGSGTTFRWTLPAAGGESD